jgi:hypothetical protein
MHQFQLLQRLVTDGLKILAKPVDVVRDKNTIVIGQEEVTITFKQVTRPSIGGDVKVNGFLVEKLVVRSLNPNFNSGFDYDADMQEVLETTAISEAGKAAINAYIQQLVEYEAQRSCDRFYAESQADNQGNMISG